MASFQIDDDDDEEEKQEEKDAALLYSKRIGTSLWGCSSQDAVLRADLLEDIARRQVGTDGKTTIGMTQRMKPTRRKFFDGCFFSEGVSIPPKKKFDVHIPCGHLHPGICKVDLSSSLCVSHRAFVLTCSSMTTKTIFEIVATYASGRTDRALKTFCRKQDPQTIVLVKTSLHGPWPELNLRSEGFLDFETGQGALLPFFARWSHAPCSL